MGPHVAWPEGGRGGYDSDLPLWGELAADAPDGVLDVGAGTGRVAIPLARAGHSVTALDNDAVLLEELSLRAGGLVNTLVADAADFTLDPPVSLIIVPMQTI